MPAPLPLLTDGDFSSLMETEGFIKSYPFINAQIKDVVTAIYERFYDLDRASYAPGAALSTDPDDANAYLVEETKPQFVAGELVRFSRTYANIPGNQVEIDTRFFSRPVMNDIKVGSVYAVTFDENETSHLFLSRKTVVRVSSFAATAISAVLPSSNITFSDGTNTVNVPANSNKAAAESILAGLTLLSGISVTVGSNIMSLVWTGTMTSIIVPSGVTIASSGSYWAGFKSLGTGNTPATTSLNAVAHGAAIGDWVAFWAGDKLVGTSQVVTITDADNFSVMTAGLNASDTIITTCAFAKSGLRVVNGPKDCSVKSTSRFYLPGVTVGIVTPQDIPGVPVYTDPIAWLGRICAGTLTGIAGTNSTGRLNKTAHGLSTGDTFFLMNLGTGLSSLAILTQYWVIKVDADNWKPAASAALALAGTALALGSDTTGATALIPAQYAAIQAPDSKSWMGPILGKTTDEVLMSDAIETRDPAA